MPLCGHSPRLGKGCSQARRAWFAPGGKCLQTQQAGATALTVCWLLDSRHVSPPLFQERLTHRDIEETCLGGVSIGGQSPRIACGWDGRG